jgi:hypothetical protein
LRDIQKHHERRPGNQPINQVARDLKNGPPGIPENTMKGSPEIGRKTRGQCLEFSRFSSGQKDHGPDRPEIGVRNKKTIAGIRTISGSKKTVKPKSADMEKDHRRREKDEMVFAAGKFGKKREQAALNHAGSRA